MKSILKNLDKLQDNFLNNHTHKEMNLLKKISKIFK